MSDILARLTRALADRYRLAHELGAGGMATVYLAEDLKHHRRVAVKVLHPELAAVLGAERFLAEIRTTANLQHPHILPLHDSGQADGLLFYVMPYVEGETLRARLEREQQLPVEDAVRITREVASALDYAHRQGVIHRDIKPENILLHEGQALIADFGIALAVSSAGGPRMTQTGMSLGTPEYMSPEQALGERAITAKSDVYALGCVLYEMLTGEPPFTGATVQAVVARVMNEEPRPISHIRKTVPVHVEAAALQALARLPADRIATAAKLAEALDGGAASALSPAPTRHAVAPPRLRWPVLVVGGAALVAAGALAGRASRYAGPPVPEVYDVVLPDSAPMAFTASKFGATELTVAPDGSFVIYTARRGAGTELWWRSLLTAEARPISGTAGAHGPVLSPSGDRVAFIADQRLKVVPVSSGPATELAQVGEDEGIEWPVEDGILVATETGQVIQWLSPAGGAPRQDSLPSCWTPAWLGQRRYLCTTGQNDVFTAEAGDTVRRGVVVGENGGTVPRNLRGSKPVRLGDRHLLVLSAEGDLQVMPFDGESVGRAVTVAAGIRREHTTQVGQFALSASGALVYAPGENAASGLMVAASADGQAEPLLPAPTPVVRWSVTPDGRMVAAVVDQADGQALRIADRTTGREWTWLEAYQFLEPQWTPGGAIRIAARLGFTQTLGPYLHGDPRVGAAPDTIAQVTSWPWLVLSDDSVVVADFRTSGFLGIMHAAAGNWRVDTLYAGFSYAPALSPDRRWLAHTITRDARFEVVITAFPSGETTWRVSTTGGYEPLWRSSRELVFRNDRTWYRVPIGTGPGDPVGRVVEWFTDPAFIDTPGRSNSILSDGRLVYVRSVARPTTTVLRVIPAFRASALRALEQ